MKTRNYGRDLWRPGESVAGIGELQGWGLAAAGQAGLVRVLEILKSEIVTTMALLGITRLDQLTPAYLDKVQPLAPAHEISAFPHMPGGRCCERGGIGMRD